MQQRFLCVKAGNESPNVGVDKVFPQHHDRDGGHDYGFSALFIYLLGLSGNECKQCATNDSGTNNTNYTC